MTTLNNEFESQIKWPPENNVSTLSLLSINVQVKTTRTHSMARHRKSPRSQRNLTVIDPLTLPKAPGGGDPKNCAGACAIHVSNSHTKSG